MFHILYPPEHQGHTRQFFLGHTPVFWDTPRSSEACLGDLACDWWKQNQKATNKNAPAELSHGMSPVKLK